MITPRRSDGLFDFADILPTVRDLAGVPGARLADEFPKDRYIDGVDQAAFLVADDGLFGHHDLQATLYTLPKKEDDKWPLDRRVPWLQIAVNTFTLLYGNDDDGEIKITITKADEKQ